MAVGTGVRWIRDFGEGSGEQRELLGGKGANLAEMVRLLGPERVPGGFTITAEACVEYMRSDREFPPELEDELGDALARLERASDRRLGAGPDPMLVSVRSGARASMPGMLETILNLGLGDEAVDGLARATGDQRFAWDSYRRFVQMFGSVCHGIPGREFEELIERRKRSRGVGLDTELDADDLRALTGEFKGLFRRRVGRDLPQDPFEQLREAVRAVFDSWLGARAISYRRIHGIPDDWGTAVNVQRMVFGNRGDASCSGVAFSRDEVTGAPTPSGDFLQNAQGEDVVSGVRTPRPLSEMEEVAPEAHAELLEIVRRLERHFGDMQDVEFTVEQGTLFILQTRNAKRPAQAAIRFAVDAVSEGLLEREAALATIDAERLDALLHPTFAPDASFEVLARGVPASPGAAKGRIAFSAEEAAERAERGEEVILVRPSTDADDVAGFHVARGVVTAEGGKASHAALVARGMGKPCVSGVSALQIDLERKRVGVDGTTLADGELLAIDGSAGVLTSEDVPLQEAVLSEEFETVLAWADEIRRLGVRANADTPADARQAREFGAEGIGLCRTEHMFMTPDRQPAMRALIMAEGKEERRAALDELLPLQQRDFEQLLRTMADLPVTVRLLDPPLHEFLPGAEEVARELEQARDLSPERVGALERTLNRIHHLAETNPMLGTRGVRLGLVYPELYETQVRALVRAALAVTDREGEPPRIEIMIPLIAYVSELRAVRRMVFAAVALEDPDRRLPIAVGTMIELPRAALIAERIAAVADFFSFGTNDLTQAAIGFSRDDAEAGFLPHYLDRGLLRRSPFETIDVDGVGALLAEGISGGRRAKAALPIGVCGEHGGDPESIAFFHSAGLDYVSCSPYRLPIARVAAAQAAVADQGTG
jgi:pyruvate, orthophosphate dikinase